MPADAHGSSRFPRGRGRVPIAADAIALAATAQRFTDRSKQSGQLETIQ